MKCEGVCLCEDVRQCVYVLCCAALRINGHGTRPPRHHGYESSSMISSDLESTSFFDSDDDASSRITATTTGQ